MKNHILITSLNLPCKNTHRHNFFIEKSNNSLKTLQVVVQGFSKSNFLIFGFQKFWKIALNIFSEIYVQFSINTQIFVFTAFVYAVQEWKYWFGKNIIMWLLVQKYVNFFNKMNFSKSGRKFFLSNKNKLRKTWLAALRATLNAPQLLLSAIFLSFCIQLLNFVFCEISQSTCAEIWKKFRLSL